MKPSTILFLGAALILLPTVVKAVAGSNISIAFDKIKSFGFSGFPPNLVMTLQFKIQNPSNEQYKIKAMLGDLFISGQDIGDVGVFTEVIIPPASQALYPVTVSVPTVGMVSDLVEVLKGTSTRDIKLSFVGKINVDGNLLPVNESITL